MPRRGPFESCVIMPLPNNDTDVYIVIEDFGAHGRSYLETDLTQADRATIVRNFISGQYENALRVISFNVAGAGRGTCPKTSPARSSIAPIVRRRRLPKERRVSLSGTLINSVGRGRHRC